MSIVWYMIYLILQDLADRIDSAKWARTHITDTMSYAHLSVTLQYSPQFEVKYKRRNFATPKNYLDFLSNYMKFLENNRNSLDQMSGAMDENWWKMRQSRLGRPQFARPLGRWLGQAGASGGAGAVRKSHENPVMIPWYPLLTKGFLLWFHLVTESSRGDGDVQGAWRKKAIVDENAIKVRGEHRMLQSWRRWCGVEGPSLDRRHQWEDRSRHKEKGGGVVAADICICC